MVHEPEKDFEPAVRDWFAEAYGEDAVDTQVYQSEPRWYCDIVVDVGFAKLFIEVENDDRAIRPGMAQAMGYAADDPVRGVPMVVTPKDHLDKERLRRLRSNGIILVREFDESEGEWVS